MSMTTILRGTALLIATLALVAYIWEIRGWLREVIDSDVVVIETPGMNGHITDDVPAEQGVSE